MRRYRAGVAALAFAFAACAGGTPGDADLGRVPPCGSLETLPPLPDAKSCGEADLGAFAAALENAVRPHAGDALVRAQLDESAQVHELCVGSGRGYAPTRARRELAQHLDAIRALPAGPACAAGRRLDLNRYQATWAQVHARETQCDEQRRVSLETRGDLLHGRSHFDHEYERCMEYDADWIVLDMPGSMRPWIYVKPEIPDPPGPRASETASRCERKSMREEKQAACIESEGWERLEPPPR